MTLQERDAFTTRWLMALKTSQADGDSKNVRIDAAAALTALRKFRRSVVMVIGLSTC
jgi:hypothetical protein